MASCEGCGRRVLWAVNEKTGKRAPVDAEPVPDGNVVLDRTMDPMRYRVLTKREATALDSPDLFGEATVSRFTLHFATCPNAEHFRRCRKCHQSPCRCPK